MANAALIQDQVAFTSQVVLLYREQMTSVSLGAGFAGCLSSGAPKFNPKESVCHVLLPSCSTQNREKESCKFVCIPADENLIGKASNPNPLRSWLPQESRLAV
jgi:hypothetical protein